MGPSIVFLAVFLTIFATTTGNVLKAEYLDTKLPTAGSCHTPFYDGNDSIYLFGGCGVNNNILKFSVSLETIQNIGNLPDRSARGTVHADNSGNIFYFGGGPGYGDVYKYNPAANVATRVAVIPTSALDHISIKYNESSSTVFIFGMSGRDLLAFDMETSTVTTVARELPFYVNQGTAVRVGNKGYIFNSANPGEGGALEFDLDILSMEPVVGSPTFPLFSRPPSAVWDGDLVYIIGGYYPDSDHPTDGIIQFNPFTLENDFFPVSNFLIDGSSYIYFPPASVYVPKNNRIYFFGGETFNFNLGRIVVHNEIWFIDLTPEFFSCANRTNGMYPYPTDCSLFVGCWEEGMTVYSCPDPLIFDPVTRTCNFPQIVECGISCVGKPDGTYPHPHDCSLYNICRSEVAKFFKCPSPLLFDPVGLRCDSSDVVNCNNTDIY